MAVAPADLITPLGPVGMTLYPGRAKRDVIAELQLIITAGAANASVLAAPVGLRDKLVRSYTLARVFMDKYVSMSTKPLTFSITDKGSHGYSKDQIQNIKDLADQYQSDFEALLSDVILIPRTIGTIAVETEVRW